MITIIILFTGNQHIVFNSQSTIQIGGRLNRAKNKIDKPYAGIMSGLVVNGARIFELAAAKDNRVSIKGDVRVMELGSLADRVGPLQRMQQVSLKKKKNPPDVSNATF